ncbi:discoidin domain-containing protein, partial [Kitasatospora indigofera]
TTSYTDTALTAGTAYTYTVRARDAAGNVSAACTALTVTTTAGSTLDTQAPSVPGGLASPSHTQNTVALSWNAATDNTGVTGYDIYRGNTRLATVTTTSYTDTALTAGTAYTYTVRARDAAGNVSAASTALTVTTTAGTGSGTLLSQGRTAWASSSEDGSTQPGNATDGNSGTRWASAFQDNQWINVDLGASHQVTGVVLNWEAAYATTYKVQVSDDPDFGTWTDLYSTSAGHGGTENLTTSGRGRYVRVLGQQRATPYGISLWEFQVYGS